MKGGEAQHGFLIDADRIDVGGLDPHLDARRLGIVPERLGQYTGAVQAVEEGPRPRGGRHRSGLHQWLRGLDRRLEDHCTGFQLEDFAVLAISYFLPANALHRRMANDCERRH